MQVWLRSVSNYGFCSWRTMYLLACISASNKGIFPNIHTSHSICIRYKRFNFCCDRSIINGTLWREQCALSAYLSLHWKHFPKNSHLTISTHELQKKSNFGCDRPLNTVTLLGGQCTLQAVSASTGGFVLKLKQCSLHACATRRESVVANSQ